MSSEAKTDSDVTLMLIVIMMAFAAIMAFMLGAQGVNAFSLIDNSHSINQTKLKETVLFVAGFSFLIGGILGLVIGIVLWDHSHRRDDEDAKPEPPPTS